MSDDTPAQREAEGTETVQITYKGVDYTFPSSLEELDGDVIDAVDNQKLSHALQAILGPDEWARFKATKPKVRDYADLFGAWASEIGLDSTGG